MNKTKLSMLTLALTAIIITGAVSACRKPSAPNDEPTSNSTEASSISSIESTEAPTEQITSIALTSEATETPTKEESDTVTDAMTESSTKEETSAITEAVTEDPTTEETHALSESATESSTNEETDAVAEYPHADIIDLTNNYANGVQSYFASSSWEMFIVENQNVSYAYSLPTEKEQYVSYIKNKQGNSYIENTMDVFVRMTDTDRIFASTSSNDAKVNVFRFGYYYYDARFEGQDFAGTVKIVAEEEIPLAWTYLNEVGGVSVVDGVLTGRTKTKSDPFIIFGENFKYDASKYNYVQVTMKTDTITGLGLYYISGNQSKFNSNQCAGFPAIIPDGEYHTYTLKLSTLYDYTDLLTGIRLDLDGGEIGAAFDISSIKLLQCEEQGVTTLQHARILHAYTDKLHQVIQIAATDTTSGIEEVGMLTEIVADTVDKLIVKDKNGLHETLDGVDWDSAEYIGFDIKDVGIFGYILPDDATSGKLSVTLEDGKYAIIQSRTPENNTILVGEGSSSNWQNVAGNTNDFYMGQRIYTDENHTFEAFLKEAYHERNPLTAKNIKVSAAYSSNASFLGYDALRGAYKFIIDGTDFNNAYEKFQNRHYKLNFTVKGVDEDRITYFVVESRSSGLECAVLLDENNMLLPIPLEVGKNFGGDGDENIFDRLDTGYGETIFPMIIDADDAKEYTLLNLYQNWGNFPLKQISFIEYHSPYYHLSVGITETNCLVPWKFTSNTAIKNLLPDHRGVSAPMWSHQPQHTSSGSHTFLHYQDNNQDHYDTNLIRQGIDSYGPTYVDLEVTSISGDNKVKFTYNHIEMPDTDENRAYYVMKYEFLEDLTISNVKNDFYFYSVGSNTGVPYLQMGWLDENNQSKIANFSDVANGSVIVLGDDCPYFDLFELENNSDYGNVSMLIDSYEVIVNGEKLDASLAIHKTSSSLRLTLNLEEMTFKAGDTIAINAIIMPWGSHQSDYSGRIFAPDQNVRDARENTLLNPIAATPVADCETLESVFIPKLRTTNGTSAEFTISGGKANQHAIKNRDAGHTMAVRIYGFTELTVPKVYQKINGEWTVYELSSANNLDKSGFGAYYDGYSVYYDKDGTYSFAFIVDMTDGVEKTFKIELDEEFEKWPLIIVDESTLVEESPFNVYWSSIDFFHQCYKGWFSNLERTSEGGISFVRMNAHKSRPESCVSLYQNTEGDVTGQYFVIKYRIPEDNPTKFALEVFASTTNENATAGDNYVISEGNGLICDGKWHVVVVDMSSYNKSGFQKDANGEYKVKYVRFDPINGQMSAENYVDVASIAIHDDLGEILDATSDMREITLVKNGTAYEIDTATGGK